MKTSLPVSLPQVTALLIGLTTPCLVFGRAALAVPVVLAVLFILVQPGRGDVFRAALKQARHPVGLLLLATLVLWLPSIMISPLPLRSFEAWVRVPVFAAVAALLWAYLFRAPEEVYLLSLKALAIVCVATTMVAIVSVSFVPELSYFIRGKGWVEVNAAKVLKEYAGVGILWAPLLLLAGLRLGKGWLALSAVCIAGLLVLVVLTFNRSAVAGLLAAVTVGAVVYAYVASRRRGLMILGVGFSATAVAVAVGFWLYKARSNFGVPEGVITILPSWLVDYQRQTIWYHTLQLSLDSPWFGKGINVINLLPGADQKIPGSRGLNVVPAHPHNWLIEVFSETGIVGGAALVILVFTLCAKLMRDYVYSRDISLLMALMISVGYWGSGMFNFSVWSAWWQICYLVLMVICLAGRRSPLQA